MQLWRAPLAWLVILSLAGLVAYRNARTNSTQAAAAGGAPLADIQMQLGAQEVIGFKALGSLIGQSQPTQLEKLNQTRTRLLQQMDAQARTPADRLHFAIITGEVLGKDSALSILDQLAPTASGDLADDIATLRVVYTNGAVALDASSRNRLIAHQEFFAHVALAFGVPAGQEPRKTLESNAVRSIGALVAVGLVLLILLLGGIGFFIVGIVLKAKGRLRRTYQPAPSDSTEYLEGFAIYFVLFILGFGLLRRYLGLASLQWEWLALAILPAVILWCRWRGATWQELRQALGWTTGRGVIREIGAGLAGYLAGLVIVIAGFVITYILVKRTGISAEHPIVHMLQGNRWHVLGLYALASGFAPFMEETMFRGALFHHLRRRWGWAISAPIVAFIFAIIHPQGWVAVPVLGSIAIVLAGLREWRGSLIAPMVAHAFNNFLALTLALILLR